MESDVVKDVDNNWSVEEEDEATYNFSEEKGVWQPKPEDILSMFEKLAKGEVLPLQWVCPGRRDPQSAKEEEQKESQLLDEDTQDPEIEETREPEPCAFDFDDTQSETGIKTTPMRGLGGLGARTPRTEKRVARMDNIMDSLRKQQMQRAAEREARRAKASPARGRLLKLGNPQSPTASAKSLSSGSPKSASPLFSMTTASEPVKITAAQLMSNSTESTTSSTASTSTTLSSSTSEIITTTTSTVVPSVIPMATDSSTLPGISSDSVAKEDKNNKIDMKDTTNPSSLAPSSTIATNNINHNVSTLSLLNVDDILSSSSSLSNTTDTTSEMKDSTISTSSTNNLSNTILTTAVSTSSLANNEATLTTVSSTGYTGLPAQAVPETISSVQPRASVPISTSSEPITTSSLPPIISTKPETDFNSVSNAQKLSEESSSSFTNTSVNETTANTNTPSQESSMPAITSQDTTPIVEGTAAFVSSSNPTTSVVTPATATTTNTAAIATESQSTNSPHSVSLNDQSKSVDAVSCDDTSSLETKEVS